MISDFTRGYPYKVLIQPTEAISTSVQLEGRKCADGAQLRFWYREGTPFRQVPVSDQQLASTGDVIVHIGPTIVSPSGNLAGYTGYMLFTATGRWRIDVSQKQRSLGSAVFQVDERP